MSTIDELQERKYGLEGRIVTMNTQRNVLDRGMLYINEEGVIEHILPSNAPLPAGYESAPIIRTGDTIFPGLIELHNHLSYNILPMWQLPRLFRNRGQWGGHDDYKRLVSGPMKILGETPGYAPAIVRYTEIKCLMGGVTTSQGYRLYSNTGIQKFYKGMVRNVENPDIPALPTAGGKIADVQSSEAESFLTRLKTFDSNGQSYLLHLAEGVDETARKRFTDLKLDDGRWAITPALVGIHASSLHAEDFDILANHGGSIVWSPFSNLLLYGDTLRIKAAKASGVKLALGSDWSPSGSKNLLGELKTARIVSNSHGDVFSNEELVAMATINAAELLRWDHILGSIEVGKRADLLVINGRQGDPYSQLIEARETAITLVIIDGTFRYGQTQLMEQYSSALEKIFVGSSTRQLHLLEPGADPVVGALSLANAKQILQDGLINLPRLAHELETSAGTGIAPALVTAGVPDEGQAWLLDLNHDDPSGVMDDDRVEAGTISELFLAGDPLSTILGPILLDPLTVADDPLFFHRLANQLNLPVEVKANLPLLYGTTPVLPDGTEFIERLETDLRSQFSGTMDLASFRARDGGLTKEERLLLVEQAQLLIEQLYVHLPQKQAMYANNPVQALRLLYYRMAQTPEENLAPEIDFHQEMTRIFNSNRDLHTNYLLPEPYKSQTAFLPFVIELYFDPRGERHYIVSKLLGDVGEPSFIAGVEVLYWNGVPIHRAVLQNAERHAGSNAAAQIARGVDSLTIRPFIRMLPPDEEWVTLRYLTLGGDIEEETFQWMVFSPNLGSDAGGVSDGKDINSTSLGYDLQTDAIHQVKKLWFASDKVAQAQVQPEKLKEKAKELGLNSIMPTVFRAEKKATKHGMFGYIRIFTFNVASSKLFVEEFVRLASLMPKGGLIIDVRGNGGGSIYAAELLLQVLTDKRIEPERAQFFNSPATLALCRAHSPSPLFSDFDLSKWKESIAQSVESGATYSRGFHITPPDWFENLGRQYEGDVVLITDALCYSATDIFAAGFQDHQIGKIIGTSENTGAGGANVWTHELLRKLMPGNESPYQALPLGASFRVSIRRMLRVGELSGMPLEDFGVVPNVCYRMSRNDIMNKNIDLIEFAGEVLAKVNE